MGDTGGYGRRPDTGASNTFRRSSSRSFSVWIRCCNASRSSRRRLRPLGLVQEGGERNWSATFRHCAAAASASSWANAVAMKAETMRRPLLPAYASALRMKWTRHRCQPALNILRTVALMPYGSRSTCPQRDVRDMITNVYDLSEAIDKQTPSKATCPSRRCCCSVTCHEVPLFN